jgi:hypothetical protein
VELVLIPRPLAPEGGGEERSEEQETGAHSAKIRGKAPVWQVLPTALLLPARPRSRRKIVFSLCPGPTFAGIVRAQRGMIPLPGTPRACRKTLLF